MIQLSAISLRKLLKPNTEQNNIPYTHCYSLASIIWSSTIKPCTVQLKQVCLSDIVALATNRWLGQTVNKDIYCHLGINTLKLFDTLFERNNEVIFRTLILRNFYPHAEALLSKNTPKIKLDV